MFSDEELEAISSEVAHKQDGRWVVNVDRAIDCLQDERLKALGIEIGLIDVVDHLDESYRDHLPRLIELASDETGDTALRLWCLDAAVRIDPKSPSVHAVVGAMQRERKMAFHVVPQKLKLR